MKLVSKKSFCFSIILRLELSARKWVLEEADKEADRHRRLRVAGAMTKSLLESGQKANDEARVGAAEEAEAQIFMITIQAAVILV